MLSEYHKKEYIYLKSYLKYFRIPTIILAGINSVCSVGLQPYLSQVYISAITCFLSLSCGIITSIELYLSVQSSMENELMSSKDFHILGLDIYKILSLSRENRLVRGQLCLEEHFTQYEKLIENSSLIVNGELKDSILNLEPIQCGFDNPSPQISPVSYKISKRRDSILKIFAPNPRQAFKLNRQPSAIFNMQRATTTPSNAVIPYKNMKLVNSIESSPTSSDDNKSLTDANTHGNTLTHNNTFGHNHNNNNNNNNYNNNTRSYNNNSQ